MKGLGERMRRTTERRFCGLGVAVAILALGFSVTLPGNVARPNDWDIWHNEEYVPDGGFCHILKDTGDNHVEGTFEWLSGDSNLTFQYTYDGIVSYSAPATWNNPYYEFDFYTNWERDYGGFFEIIPSNELADTYHCDTYV